MNNEKRLILAVTMSVLVMLAYQSYMRKFQKPLDNRITNRIMTTTSSATTSLGEQTATQLRSAESPEPTESETPEAGQEHTVVIESARYKATVSDRKAGIKELYLKGFANNKVALPLRTDTAKGPYILATEDTTMLPDGSKWEMVDKKPDEVIYISRGKIFDVTKDIKLHNTNHTIELQLKIKNKTGQQQQVRYKITGAPAVAAANPLDARYVGADIKTAGVVTRRKPASKSIQEGEVLEGTPEWASAISRYFSFVLKPKQEHQAAFIESKDKKNIWSGIILGPVTIGPNETLVRDYILYAGPNKIDQISMIGINAYEIINYGKLGGIAKVIFKALAIFYKISGNYGIAIILLALAISLILFPLTRKSLRSMKEMQKIQPETERIRKECGDNPKKMNKEIMELYKKHNINPISGCLPMFLQLPIFIALYQVLLRSVELKGASFLWIKDLSEPDAAFTLGSKLPILGNHVNILPILMAIAMAVQQKISQPGTGASEQQKMMSTIMPVMMAVIFYNLPSGLVLYWLTNTLLMLLLQEVVLKSRTTV